MGRIVKNKKSEKLCQRLADYFHRKWEHLQSKYIGTGHADTTKYEWATNQQRDSCASYMGHFDLMNHFAIAENESKARIRLNLMEKLIQPCGPPPEKKQED